MGYLGLEEEKRGQGNECKNSSWSDENVLKLHYGDGYPTL